MVNLSDDGGFEYRYIDYGLVGFLDAPNRVHYPWEQEKYAD